MPGHDITRQHSAHASSLRVREQSPGPRPGAVRTLVIGPLQGRAVGTLLPLAAQTPGGGSQTASHGAARGWLHAEGHPTPTPRALGSPGCSAAGSLGHERFPLPRGSLRSILRELLSAWFFDSAVSSSASLYQQDSRLCPATPAPRSVFFCHCDRHFPPPAARHPPRPPPHPSQKHGPGPLLLLGFTPRSASAPPLNTPRTSSLRFAFLRLECGGAGHLPP